MHAGCCAAPRTGMATQMRWAGGAQGWASQSAMLPCIATPLTRCLHGPPAAGGRVPHGCIRAACSGQPKRPVPGGPLQESGVLRRWVLAAVARGRHQMHAPRQRLRAMGWDVKWLGLCPQGSQGEAIMWVGMNKRKGHFCPSPYISFCMKCSPLLLPCSGRHHGWLTFAGHGGSGRAEAAVLCPRNEGGVADDACPF